MSNMEKRKTMSTILGTRLKQLRSSKDLKLAEVSNRAGLTPQVISLYERALRIPSVEALSKLARVYEVEDKELIQIRELTVVDTVNLLGDDAPPSMKNERNMILHARNSSPSDQQENNEYNLDDSVSQQWVVDGTPLSDEELKDAQDYIRSIRIMRKLREND
ncbi:helix-turn-helix transcriptional regulator [Lysinibacillus xylanilyticus]|uniref:helix-turn-helix domain-containing protein n=1 Tax=Lysinibacillus xylanilyticus TaxID=582475 RepID=UPI002B240E01|nr:helix-turn-helix transcriptional regulator [Lysinibacillus xylanilyticus]MEB2279710.1 helix-turn-helix transcriptional regulator [Lysinibacillus xylanilyticus]